MNVSKTEKERENKMENTSQYDETIQNKMKRGRGRPKIHTDVPSHLTCSVTGNKVKTTPVQFRKQLEKSGLDRETFLATYVSRAGRRIQKEQKNTEEVSNISPVDTGSEPI